MTISANDFKDNKGKIVVVVTSANSLKNGFLYLELVHDGVNFHYRVKHNRRIKIASPHIEEAIAVFNKISDR